jgi:NAD(P)-dependent dehydrogenase (short-subunit alcohol dehydrogenase family)
MGEATLAYWASKAFVNAAVQALAVERAALRINGASPGFIETDLVASLVGETAAHIIKRRRLTAALGAMSRRSGAGRGGSGGSGRQPLAVIARGEEANAP